MAENVFVDFRIAGVTFEGRQEVIKVLNNGDFLALVREPDNKYDANAIKVLRSDGVSCGYVPKNQAMWLAGYMDSHETPAMANTGVWPGVVLKVHDPTRDKDGFSIVGPTGSWGIQARCVLDLTEYVEQGEVFGEKVVSGLNRFIGEPQEESDYDVHE